VFKTRTINKKWGQYFGPYSHIGSMYALLEIINKIYKPRTCRQPITKEGIALGKYKPCLEYYIHNCGAPCIGKQSYEDYMENMNQAREILKGHTREVQRMLFEEMQKAAEELRFEHAQALKIRYEALENFASKSEVVSHTINDVDVFSITSDEKNAFINYIHVERGQVNQSFTFEYKKKLNESDEELLQLGIVEMRERFNSKAKEIILPEDLDIQLEGVTITIPVRGDKRKLLDLYPERQTIQIRPSETGRETQSRTAFHPSDERASDCPETAQNALSDRMFRQFKHLGYGCRCRMRGFQGHETLEKGLPEVQYQDRYGP
jgi:excinuclease ABC subunit C